MTERNTLRRRYKELLAEAESIVGEDLVRRGFSLGSRIPNLGGRASAVVWERRRSWKHDEVRLLFFWCTGRRRVYADITTRVLLPSDAAIHVASTNSGQWLTRRSEGDPVITDRWALSHAALPSDVERLLRIDLVEALDSWDKYYSAPLQLLHAFERSRRAGSSQQLLVHKEVRDFLRSLPAEWSSGAEVSTPEPPLDAWGDQMEAFLGGETGTRVLFPNGLPSWSGWLRGALRNLLHSPPQKGKVRRLGIPREPGYRYYVTVAGAIMRASTDRADAPHEEISRVQLPNEPGETYYLDEDGDLARFRLG